jgi:hypothetical protein
MMKRIVLLHLLVACGTAGSIRQPPVEETWSGDMTQDGQPVHFVLRFQRDAQRKWAGTLSFPTLGVENVALAEIHDDGKTRDFTLAIASADVRFHTTIVGDGMTGELRQDQESSPLVAHRVASEAKIAVSAPPAQASESLASAMSRARDTRRPLILEFSTQWCEPCREFQQRVLPDPGVQRALQDFVFVSYDAEVEPGQTVAGDRHVTLFPTFMALGSDGREALTASGIDMELTPAAFLAFLDRAAAVSQTDR